jgi:hypothetical protein
LPKKGYKQTEEHRKKSIDNAKGNKSNLGKVMSEEQKKKISENMPDRRGDKNPMFEKKHSKEIRKKISENLPDRHGKNHPMYGRTGDKHHNWNPNKTDEERLDDRSHPTYIEWRLAVYEKDNYTCQKCGDNKGGNLEAHHIESYANNKGLRTTVLNGATLCVPCHKDFHRQYGIESTAEKFAEFLK